MKLLSLQKGEVDSLHWQALRRAGHEVIVQDATQFSGSSLERELQNQKVDGVWAFWPQVPLRDLEIIRKLNIPLVLEMQDVSAFCPLGHGRRRQRPCTQCSDGWLWHSLVNHCPQSFSDLKKGRKIWKQAFAEKALHEVANQMVFQGYFHRWLHHRGRWPMGKMHVMNSLGYDPGFSNEGADSFLVSTVPSGALLKELSGFNWQPLEQKSLSGTFLVWQESPIDQSKTAMQAMALGCPLLVPCDEHWTEWVQDGVNGLVYDPSHVGSLRDCMSYLSKRPEERRRMGRESRLRFERLHSPRINLEKCLCIMQAAGMPVQVRSSSGTSQKIKAIRPGAGPWTTTSATVEAGEHGRRESRSKLQYWTMVKMKDRGSEHTLYLQDESQRGLGAVCYDHTLQTGAILQWKGRAHFAVRWIKKEAGGKSRIGLECTVTRS